MPVIVRNRSFSIIGAGNLGIRLTVALVSAGYRLQSIYKKVKLPIPLLENAIENDIDRLAAESEIIIIATQESRIPSIVRSMVKTNSLGGKYVYHTSNSLTSDELLALKTRGAYVASLSPLQTFSGIPIKEQLIPDLFKGIYFLTEGDAAAIVLSHEIGKRLGAHVLEVAREDKPYIHIAAVSAANFLIAVLALAERQLEKTGRAGVEILMPMIKQTLANVEMRGIGASLTGPASRRETDIIQKHLELLEGNDKDLYRALTEYILKNVK